MTKTKMIIHRTVSLSLIFSVTIIIFCASSITIAFATELDDLVMDGEKEFQENCAICHGNDAKGDGPYTIALTVKPSDLTKLLIENDGYFPFLETFMIIDGREMIRLHGTRLMPVWGDRYKEDTWSHVSPEYANTLARGRIFELLIFLYSIQEPEM